jgi:hypothetical protein
MHFLSPAECREWVREIAPLDSRAVPEHPGRSSRYARGPVTPTTELCRRIEQALTPRESLLLWVTDWGIWSAENLHLYYRLRQSYGDLRQLEDAPGHLFHSYEAADLVSFLQVAILNGWDAHLIPYAGYARAFVSHDEYVELAADAANPEVVTEFAAGLAGAQVYPIQRSA